ncbi:hypothetical protein CJP46_14920 [Paenibacillus sp. XY044]|nr:hypothetical protein CJP46_14920 [Paenibacillus sp. XY044]
MEDFELIEGYRRDLNKYSTWQLRYIPGPEIWSIGQMYDHLIAVAMEYLAYVQACAESTEEQPLGKTPNGEELFRRGSFPQIKIKLEGAQAASPNNALSREELDAGLVKVMGKMQEWESKLDGVHPDGKVRHGGFGWLNAQEWYRLIGMHFRHHLRQQAELEQRLLEQSSDI